LNGERPQVAFDLYIGIDYSGAGTATSRSSHLQVYAVLESRGPEPVRTPAAPEGQHWNWSRKEIAEWLIDLAESTGHPPAAASPL
jgi:hypothetical protein